MANEPLPPAENPVPTVEFRLGALTNRVDNLSDRLADALEALGKLAQMVRPPGP